MINARHKQRPQKLEPSASNAERAGSVRVHTPGHTDSHFGKPSSSIDVPETRDPVRAPNSMSHTEGPPILKPPPSLIALARLLGQQAAREALRKDDVL